MKDRNDIPIASGQRVRVVAEGEYVGLRLSGREDEQLLVRIDGKPIALPFAQGHVEAIDASAPVSRSF